MRKEQIKVCDVYIVKVSGKEVPVRITHAPSYGGYYGENLVTGRTIRIRTAARIRRPVVGLPVTK